MVTPRDMSLRLVLSGTVSVEFTGEPESSTLECRHGVKGLPKIDKQAQSTNPIGIQEHQLAPLPTLSEGTKPSTIECQLHVKDLPGDRQADPLRDQPWCHTEASFK